jgi:hypothetical protein
MPEQTKTWIPPSLCGCRLRITAEFTGDESESVSYRHPKPFTVSNIQIIDVCPAHAPIAEKVEMPDTSRFFDLPEPGAVDHFLAARTGVKPAPRQTRGYLHYPIANPTGAECLYTALSMHRGQTHSLACGCQGFMHYDQDNHGANPDAAGTYREHPAHTRRCDFHQGDTVDMAQARLDHEAYLARSRHAGTTASQEAN